MQLAESGIKLAELQDIKPAGWRARIGVIVPPSNTINEVEFNRLKPDGVSFHFTRSPIHHDPAADNYATLLSDLDKAVGELSACNVDLMAYGCTAGSMACPADILIGRMEEGGKVGAVSTAGSILAALEALGVKRIAMATPYTDETNEHEKEFFAENGVEVVAMAGLGLNTSLENVQKISRVPAAEVYQHARSVDCAEAEAVLICCTDFGTLDVIGRLEQELGKPVITSNTASLWNSLRRAGISDPIKGYGKLLSDY